MAITNIIGQKPIPITEVNTLDQALSKKFANANENRLALIEAIKDILLQYKSNFNLETDERNVKIVDCILKRHEALLKNILSEETSIQNILTALDLNVEDWLSRFYLISKPTNGPDEVRSIKENVVKCVLEALGKYTGKDVKTITTELSIETETIDKNQNIDNFTVLDNYFKNILSFMKDLYKSKLTTIKKDISVETNKLKNLITKLTVLKKQNKPGFFNSKLTLLKSKLSEKFNKPITKDDRLPKKSINPFKKIDLSKRLGLNTHLKKGLKKILDISGATVITGVVSKLSKKIMDKIKPLINGIKKVINKIKKTIINFVLTLIPFVGPILKIIQFVVKPIIFTLKFAFKLLSFTIKFIGKSVKLLFTGAFKIMSGLTKGIFASVKLLTAGITKILNTNVIEKIVSFMLSPTGAFVTGFLVGMLYVKIWKPIKEKIDEVGGIRAAISLIYTTIKDKIINWKNILKTKYLELKDKFNKPGGKFGEALKFLLTLDRHKLIAAWEKAKIELDQTIIQPVKKVIEGLKMFFVEGVVRAGAGKIVSLIMKCLSKFAPWGTLVAGVVGIGQGIWELLFENSDDKRNEKDEINAKKQQYLKLYGVNSLDRQASHASLLDLLALASSDKSTMSASLKKKINNKVKAEKLIGTLSLDQQKQVDSISDLIKDELKICSKYSNYSKDQIQNADPEKSNEIITTKIPIPSKINPDGSVAESQELLDLPDSINPITFRMIRANMLYKMLQQYNNGLISFDDLMQYYTNLTLFDSSGKVLINSELLENEKKESKVDVSKMLNFNQFGNVDRTAMSSYLRYTNSDDFLNKAELDAKLKRGVIDGILGKLMKAKLFDFIPFDKRAVYMSKFTSALMKMDLNEFMKKGQDEQIKWLMDLYEDLNIDIEKELAEEAKAMEAKVEAEQNAEDDKLASEQNTANNRPTDANSLTTESILETPTAADLINKSDKEVLQNTEKQTKEGFEAAVANSTNEAEKAKKDTTSVKTKLSQKIDNIIERAKQLQFKKSETSVLSHGSDENPALEEARRIMKEYED